MAILLPLALVGLLLHYGGRNGGWRRGEPHPGVGVYYRDSIASAQSRGLVNLHLLVVVGLVASDGIVGVV